MTFNPTQEQIDIFTAAVEQTQPVIIINAGPGCGKTTTIVELVKLLAPTWKQQWKANRCNSVYMALNKDIVTSTEAKFKDAKVNSPLGGIFKINCTTTHALCMSLWSLNLEPQQKLNIDTGKNKALLRAIQDHGRHSIPPEEWETLMELLKLAKSQGYLPPASGSIYKSLVSFETICEMADCEPDPARKTIVDLALKACIKASFALTLDFDDMLYMVAFFWQVTKKYQWIFVDEAQDLSPIQLFLLKRLNPEFLVLVGDPHQAIYGFRGAMTNSFEMITAQYPTALELPLQTSFRIPRNILPLLRNQNPALTTMSPMHGIMDAWAGGSIDSLLAEAPKSQAIICRNNAPLYRVALACVAARIPFQMSDTRWGEGLMKDVRRLHDNPQSWPVDAGFHARVAEFFLDRAGDDKRKRDAAWDKVAAIQALCDTTSPSDVAALLLTLQSILRKANASDKAKPLLLSTAHKAKGLEFDFVVHLDSHLIPAKFAETDEELRQEANIAYVINSRSRNTLIFAESDSITIPGALTPSRRPNIKRNQPL